MLLFNEVIIKGQGRSSSNSNYYDELRGLREKIVEQQRAKEQYYQSKINKLKQAGDEQEKEILRRMEE